MAWIMYVVVLFLFVGAGRFVVAGHFVVAGQAKWYPILQCGAVATLGICDLELCMSHPSVCQFVVAPPLFPKHNGCMNVSVIIVDGWRVVHELFRNYGKVGEKLVN